MLNKQRRQVGQMSPDGKQLFVEGATAGQLLDETIVDVPASYLIQSAEDAAYAKPAAPTAVFRKGKPNGPSKPLPFLYTISLRLPSPIKEGATYTIRFHGVNTSKETVAYTHKPRATRSLAIHAIQTGYRPDDPYKRAYLSFWMGVDQDGKSGSCTPKADAFELLDASGKSVFSGKAELAKADGDAEQISIHEKLDYTKAAVYRLDFSAFNQPGEYRVFVPGIGVSGRFRIAADVWEKPFKAAMQGIFTQRQGIELGPPITEYRRARTFRPDDGVQFYQMTIPVQGANPDNLSYCTGVGDNAQHFNFIVDALISGQQPDKIVGHIPYGQGNEGNAMSRGANAWVQQWLLNFDPTKKMVPNWFDWPVTEQYIDFAIFPLHNENCFNQTTVPAACYWFYLATRPSCVR
jgi:hypothetical protein